MAAIIARQFKLKANIQRITQDSWDNRMTEASSKVYENLFQINGSENTKPSYVNLNYRVGQVQESESGARDSVSVVVDHYEAKKAALAAGKDFLITEFSYHICMEGCETSLDWKLWESKGGYLALPAVCGHDTAYVQITQIANLYDHKCWMVNQMYARIEINSLSFYLRIGNPWPWGIWKNAQKLHCKFQRIITRIISNLGKDNEIDQIKANSSIANEDTDISDTDKTIESFKNVYKSACEAYLYRKIE